MQFWGLKLGSCICKTANTLPQGPRSMFCCCFICILLWRQYLTTFHLTWPHTHYSSAFVSKHEFLNLCKFIYYILLLFLKNHLKFLGCFESYQGKMLCSLPPWKFSLFIFFFSVISRILKCSSEDIMLFFLYAFQVILSNEFSHWNGLKGYVSSKITWELNPYCSCIKRWNIWEVIFSHQQSF